MALRLDERELGHPAEDNLVQGQDLPVQEDDLEQVLGYLGQEDTLGEVRCLQEGTLEQEHH